MELSPQGTTGNSGTFKPMELSVPSTSDKQRRTMQAAAHNPAFAAKMKIPQKVARDFEAADKGTKHKPATKKRK